MPYQSLNPATGELLKTFTSESSGEVLKKLEQSYNAQKKWAQISFKERKELQLNLVQQLKINQDELATLMTLEMGKPFGESLKEIEKCVWVLEYYAQNAEDFLKPQQVNTDYHTSEIHFEPLGVLLGIMPWNFPLWQVFRLSAAHIMSGNTLIVKHAPSVPQCAKAIEDLYIGAGYPQSIYTNTYAENDTIKEVIRSPMLAAVSLTGSTRAGKEVAKIAGENLKKCVLELGGSDPYIVLADADIDQAIDACLASRMLNNGQSCIAAKRFIVHQSLNPVFTEKLLSKIKDLRVGDPMSLETQIGPLAREDLRETLHDQVMRSIKLGAKALTGASFLNGPGYYYPPTLLVDVPLESPAFNEELFGPVASLIYVESEESAFELANKTSYGLGAAVFGNRENLLESAPKALNAGSVFINDFVKSDPRLPFGGIKYSGYGRELSRFGIYEFTNIKTIVAK